MFIPEPVARAQDDRRLHPFHLHLLVLCWRELDPVEFREAKVGYMARRSRCTRRWVQRGLKLLAQLGYLARRPPDANGGPAHYRLIANIAPLSTTPQIDSRWIRPAA